MTVSSGLEDLLRGLAPQVLGSVLRRGGDFGAAEDAVQESLLAAATTWPAEGVPANPRGWLITVAVRRLVDWQRREFSRSAKEAAAADWLPDDDPRAAPTPVTAVDDSLALLFLCCHPALAPTAQVALTLRAVGGLTTAEIARAFLVPETTMARRITRAKRRIADTGARFAAPSQEEFDARLPAVLEVLYLIFNEGYTATSGESLHRADLTAEAIRLTRQLHAGLPGNGEVIGLLALMLLTDARKPARTDVHGRLIPLTEQDRSLWNADRIAEGVELISGALRDHPVGPYQVQAAIAALHDEAPSAEDTDWPQILALYRLLERLAPGPIVRLNHAVAVAMVDGPSAGLDLLATLDDDRRLAHHHRLLSVRAHLLELAGDTATALATYRNAARSTASTPERQYLLSRASRLSG